MKISMRSAIIATVRYRGIFDYPLTIEEVYVWLIKKTGKRQFDIALAALFRSKTLFSVAFDGKKWIVPSFQTRTLQQRKHRYEIALMKWSRAQVASRLLSLVPTISFIGITGGLAMDNVDDVDDIDIFLIVEPSTLWISRFCAVMLMELLGVRRRPGTKRVRDTMCLNFFLSRQRLGLPASDQNIFSAYEILQCKPLYDKRGVYKEFLEANTWVKSYLPNAWKRKNSEWQMASSKLKEANIVTGFGIFVLKLFEYPAKVFQTWYMRNRRTSEIVTDTVLRFHPRNMRDVVKKELTKRLKQYNIPIDTIFYSI